MHWTVNFVSPNSTYCIEFMLIIRIIPVHSGKFQIVEKDIMTSKTLLFLSPIPLRNLLLTGHVDLSFYTIYLYPPLISFYPDALVIHKVLCIPISFVS